MLGNIQQNMKARLKHKQRCPNKYIDPDLLILSAATLLNPHHLLQPITPSFNATLAASSNLSHEVLESLFCSPSRLPSLWSGGRRASARATP